MHTDSYLVWEAQESPVTVLFKIQLLCRLNSWLTETRGSREQGGILLGQRESDTSGRVLLTVEDCEPVRSNEREILKRIAWWRSRRNPLFQPLGLVRSESRAEFHAPDADAALLYRYFSQPQTALLILRKEDEPSGVFVLGNESSAPFPLNGKAVDDAGLPVLYLPEVVPDTAVQRRLPPALLATRTLALFAAVVLAIIAAVVSFWPPSPGVRAASSKEKLDLHVQHAGTDLRLSWNPHAPAVERAAEGSVLIADGQQQRRIDLNKSQLAQGSTVYTPSTSDVDFRFEVGADPDKTTESVRLLDALPLAPRQPVIEPSVRQAKPDVRAARPQVHTKKTIAASTSPQLVKVSLTFVPEPESFLRRQLRKLKGLSIRKNSHAKVHFQPAQPVRPTEQIETELAHGYPGAVDLKFRVSIDNRGKVSKVVNLTPNARDKLVTLASQSLYRSRFTPAKLNGHDVPSQIFATFEFRDRQTAQTETRTP